MIWQRLAGILLKYRLWLILIMGGITACLAYVASKVELSYDFVKAIPANDPDYLAYLSFKQQFGEDGNLLVVGVQTEKFFEKDFFSGYYELSRQIRAIPAVQDVLSVPTAVNLVRDDSTHQLEAVRIFPGPSVSDSLIRLFRSLPFYQGLLYNPGTGAYLMAIRIDKNVLNSPGRTAVVNRISEDAANFGKVMGVRMRLSGLPLIRTVMADKVARELKLFLLLSLVLTALILFLFFRSLIAVGISLVVVLTGVIWSTATIVILGYKITLLTGLIPPLIVVIGIPNCVYFLNKYHSQFALHGNKIKSLVRMVERMGIVTLFTNLTAAIGFGVFCYTNSSVLREFGFVAGINILLLFVISLVLLPTILSYFPEPEVKHTTYLENRLMLWILAGIDRAVFHHRPWIYGGTLVLIGVAVLGMMKLNTVAFIVDDIPHSSPVYQDLEFFQQQFNGVMPLEILVNTRRRSGIFSLKLLGKLDSLSQLLASKPQFGKPLSVTEGIKFAMQAYYGGNQADYRLPNEFELPFIAPYLSTRKEPGRNGSQINELLSSFMDSTRQIARVSVNMKDIGSRDLAALLSSLQPRVNRIFDTARYRVTFTGTSMIFLEGSRYIIHGLKESILLAVLLILCCMLYLFRSWKMLAIALVPNLIPLAVTAGIMGLAGVHLKPSTVLVFSVALGIAIDVTIRFLINFRQELPRFRYDISATVRRTIHETGLSIVFTGLILIAGFLIFSFSGFEGTRALGWLTSLTLVLAMVSNLTLLPALLLWMERHLWKKASAQEPLWSVMEDEMDIDLDRLGLHQFNQQEGQEGGSR